MKLSPSARIHFEDTILGLLLLMAPRLKAGRVVVKIRRYSYPEASYYIRRGLGGVLVVVHQDSLGEGLVKLCINAAFEALEVSQNRTTCYRIQEII